MTFRKYMSTFLAAMLLVVAAASGGCGASEKKTETGQAEAAPEEHAADKDAAGDAAAGTDATVSAIAEDAAPADGGENADPVQGSVPEGDLSLEAAPDPLKVWAWDTGYAIAAMREAEVFYRKDHPGFALEIVEKSPEEIETALLTAGAASDSSLLPDILLLPDDDFILCVKRCPSLFTDLTRSGIDYDQFDPQKVACSKRKGVNYGIPFDLGTVCAAYRTDILKAAQLSVDEMTDLTWEEWMEKGRRILDITGHPLIAVREGSADLLVMMLQSKGLSLYDKDGKVDFAGNEELRRCILLYRDALQQGIIMQVKDDKAYRAAVTEGTAAGIIGGSGTLSIVMSNQQQSGLWAVTNMPCIEESEQAGHYADIGASSWAVTVECHQLSAAEDFFRNTFGGSVRFYETLLPVTGTISAYLPTRESTVYGMPREFFGGQSVYALMNDFAARVPSVKKVRREREVRECLGSALRSVLVDGVDVGTALETAQTAARFLTE